MTTNLSPVPQHSTRLKSLLARIRHFDGFPLEVQERIAASALKKKSWSTPVGIFAASMSMLAGYPLGLHNVAEVQRFSMFLPAPIMSIGLLIYLLLPSTQKMLEAWNSKG